ncbi:MAG TPA: hypothetical protein VFJ58_08975 [Armatimonadota bacterium]|nr:hypothetical protein [Armatimonadota bacterium]
MNYPPPTNYPPRRSRTSGVQKLLNRYGPFLVLAVIVIVLWQTGYYITIRNWINNLYGSGANAVTESQQTFQSGLAKSRQRQTNRDMGVTNTPR